MNPTPRAATTSGGALGPAVRHRVAAALRTGALTVLAAVVDVVALDGVDVVLPAGTDVTLAVAALLSVGVVPWRRRFPGAVTGLALLAAAFGMTGALLVVLFTRAVHRPDRGLVVLAGGGALVSSCLLPLLPGQPVVLPSAYWYVNVALNVVTTVLVVGAGVLVGRARAQRAADPDLRSFATRVSPRARDLVLMMASLGVDGVSLATLGATGRPLMSGTLMLLAALGAAALWWRRQHPVAVTALGVLLSATYLSGVAAVGLLTLAIRRRDRVLAALAVAAVAATVVAGLDNGAGLAVLGTAFVSALGIGAVVALGAFVGVRRDLVDTLRERADRAEAERELRADQARLAERARIAGEMHDVLAHKVSLIALHAGGLEVRPDVDREQVERTAALIRLTAREALEDLRGVLGVLRTQAEPGTALAPQPGIDQVQRLVESSRAAGVAVRLEQDVAGDPPPVVSRTAHRVVQEALTNVHKHARSASTTVRVRGAHGLGLDVEVVNEVPVAVDSLLPGAGMGLVGLAERVGLVGGVLDYGRTPEGGWRVQAHLPWTEQGDAG